MSRMKSFYLKIISQIINTKLEILLVIAFSYFLFFDLFFNYELLLASNVILSLFYYVLL